jgi:hypothetical protein
VCAKCTSPAGVIFTAASSACVHPEVQAGAPPSLAKYDGRLSCEMVASQTPATASGARKDRAFARCSVSAMSCTHRRKCTKAGTPAVPQGGNVPSDCRRGSGSTRNDKNPT